MFIIMIIINQHIAPSNRHVAYNVGDVNALYQLANKCTVSRRSHQWHTHADKHTHIQDDTRIHISYIHDTN